MYDEKIEKLQNSRKAISELLDLTNSELNKLMTANQEENLKLAFSQNSTWEIQQYEVLPNNELAQILLSGKETTIQVTQCHKLDKNGLRIEIYPNEGNVKCWFSALGKPLDISKVKSVLQEFNMTIDPASIDTLIANTKKTAEQKIEMFNSIREGVKVKTKSMFDAAHDAIIHQGWKLSSTKHNSQGSLFDWIYSNQDKNQHTVVLGQNLDFDKKITMKLVNKFGTEYNIFEIDNCSADYTYYLVSEWFFNKNA